jgi:hypothetical protein
LIILGTRDPIYYAYSIREDVHRELQTVIEKNAKKSKEPDAGEKNSFPPDEASLETKPSSRKCSYHTRIYQDD